MLPLLFLMSGSNHWLESDSAQTPKSPWFDYEHTHYHFSHILWLFGSLWARSPAVCFYGRLFIWAELGSQVALRGSDIFVFTFLYECAPVQA